MQGERCAGFQQRRGPGHQPAAINGHGLGAWIVVQLWIAPEALHPGASGLLNPVLLHEPRLVQMYYCAAFAACSALAMLWGPACWRPPRCRVGNPVDGRPQAPTTLLSTPEFVAKHQLIADALEAKEEQRQRKGVELRLRFPREECNAGHLLVFEAVLRLHHKLGGIASAPEQLPLLALF